MGDYVYKDQYGVFAVLDRSKMEEPKEIRFIYPDYQEKFRIPDGDQILVTYPTGERKAFVCKYIDDYHVLIGRNAFHICEYAERLQRLGARVYPFPERQIVWSDMNLKLTDWIETIKAKYPNANEDKWEEIMHEENLDVFYNETQIQLAGLCERDIVAVSQIVQNNGNQLSFREYEGGDISMCLSIEGDRTEWYVDRDGEFRCTQLSCDKSEEILYRQFKAGTSVEDKEKLFDTIRRGDMDMNELNRVTEKIGHIIGAVYGWEFPTEQKERVSARDAR